VEDQLNPGERERGNDRGTDLRGRYQPTKEQENRSGGEGGGGERRP
jgi:hypothetical protein